MTQRRLHFSESRPGPGPVPEGIPPSAGALVDRAGLKGQRAGGARVSPTHGNFIVNEGGATAADIRRTDRSVPSASARRFGVELREEIVYLGVLMSTLRVEGGRPLSGRIDVEATRTRRCRCLPRACSRPSVRADERAAHPRRRGDGGLLVGSRRARSKGMGTTTLRVRCHEIVKDEPDPRWSGKLRGFGAAARSVAGASGPARLAPPGGDFPARRTISTHLEALRAMGAVRLGRAGPCARSARRAQGGVDLSGTRRR